MAIAISKLCSSSITYKDLNKIKLKGKSIGVNYLALHKKFTIFDTKKKA